MKIMNLNGNMILYREEHFIKLFLYIDYKHSKNYMNLI